MATRSDIFKTYNSAKRLVTAGTITRKRLDRALGLALRGLERPYHTTPESCDCPDATFNRRKGGKICKHQIALALSSVRWED